MKFLKKYDDFEPVKEGMGDYGIGSTGTQPMDPSLAMDPFDRFSATKQQQITTLVQISNSLRSLHDGTGPDESNIVINQVYILKMFNNNMNLLDIYLKFIIGDHTFLAIFQNWGGFQTSYFKSPTFDEVYGNSSIKIKVMGMLKNILTDYFKPDTGNWIVNAGINVRDEWGQIIFVNPGSKITVDEVFTEDDHPKIKVIYKDKVFNIQDIDFYWFKWNCEPEPRMPVSNI